MDCKTPPSPLDRTKASSRASADTSRGSAEVPSLNMCAAKECMKNMAEANSLRAGEGKFSYNNT